MAVANTNFEADFSSHILTDVNESGAENYRGGPADVIIIDLCWKGRRYDGKKLRQPIILSDSSAENSKCILARFCKEIKLLSQMKHDNVVLFVGVYCYKPNESTVDSLTLPMLVMERMPFSLTQYINAFQHIPEADIIDIMCNVATGLTYLHEDKMVVHCDLSSNNILLTSGFSAKIANFGSAQSTNKSGVCHSTTHLVMQPGTPDFMPPEALTDPPCYTVSVDVFSFGCIVIHLTTCQWPTPVGNFYEVSELDRRQSFISMMGDSHLLLPIVKQCLGSQGKRPSCKDLLLSLANSKTPKKRVMNGDQMCMVFKMIRENGMKQAVEYLVTITSNPSSLVPVRRDFRDVESGDHLVCKTTSGWNVHFYVVAILGKGKIQIVGTFLEGNEDPFIEERLIFRPKKAEKLKIRERILHEAQVSKHNDIKKVLYRNTSHFAEEKARLEMYRVQRSLYNFLDNNSEHFVTFIKTSISTCQTTVEIENVLKKFIFVSSIENNNMEASNHAIASGSWALLLVAFKNIIAIPETATPARLAVREVLQADDAVKGASKTAALQATKYTVTETMKKGGQVAAVQYGKEVVMKGTKIGTVQASKGIVKEVVKGGSKGTTTLAASNIAKEVVKGGGGKGGTIQETKGVVKGGLKRATTQPSKDVVKGRVKGATAQLSKDMVKGGVKRVTTQASKDVGIKRATTKVNEDVVKGGDKETTDQASKGIVKGGNKGTTDQASKDIVKGGCKGTTDQASKDIGKGTTDQASRDIIREECKGSTNQTSKDVSKGRCKETTDQARKDIGDKVTTVQASNDIVKEVVKRESKATTVQASKDAVKEVSNKGTAGEGVAKAVAKGGAIPQEGTATEADSKKSVVNAAKDTGSMVLVQPLSKEILKEDKTSVTQNVTAVQQDDDVKEKREVSISETTKDSSSTITQQVSEEVVNQTAKNVTSTTARNTAAVAAQHTLKATVVAQLAVEGALYSVQMGRAIYKHMKGQMDQEEFVDYTVKQTATSGGSAAGGISGSLAGAAAGATFGSIFPIVGTAVGSLVGGVVGGISGGVGGSFLGKETGKAITSMWKESNKWQVDMQNPGNITTTSNGELVVLDSSASQAFIFSSGLSLIKILTFTGEGEIIKPEGIAASDVIAISDRKKHVVKLFTIEGKYLSTIGSRLGSKEGQFDFPLGVCFNSKGILYVVDCCNFRVQAFDTKKNNAFCGIVGSEGSGPGQFQHPEYIAIDSSDHVYVTDDGSNCINMYSGDHHLFVCKIDCNRPCAIALTLDHHLIAGDRENNCLYVFHHPHEKGYLFQLTNVLGSKGCGRGEFNEICGLAVNEQGTVYIAESENNRLQVLGTSIWRTAMLEAAAHEKL